jgi:protein-S-isoprenylcysteine O-methyltransferase Ste14
MYVAVLTIVLGWSLAFGSPLLALYLVALAIGLHLRVVVYEKPQLRQQFDSEYKAYAATVPRWLPRLKPGKGERLT